MSEYTPTIHELVSAWQYVREIENRYDNPHVNYEPEFRRWLLGYIQEVRDQVAEEKWNDGWDRGYKRGLARGRSEGKP